jgi:hypothetical protein
MKAAACLILGYLVSLIFGAAFILISLWDHLKQTFTGRDPE